MKKNIQIKEYHLSDFYLTAYLLCVGMELIGTEKEPSGKVIFILKDIPKRQEIINKYFSNRARVSPLEYKSKIADLKTLLYNT